MKTLRNIKQADIKLVLVGVNYPFGVERAQRQKGFKSQPNTNLWKIFHTSTPHPARRIVNENYIYVNEKASTPMEKKPELLQTIKRDSAKKFERGSALLHIHRRAQLKLACSAACWLDCEGVGGGGVRGTDKASSLTLRCLCSLHQYVSYLGHYTGGNTVRGPSL